MTTQQQYRGQIAETTARQYLKKAGLHDIAANARFRAGEIDLIMADNNTLVFVEVRYRSNTTFGGAAASVDNYKQKRLIRAAQLFLKQHPQYTHYPCRFDVIEAHSEPLKLNWLKDAFRLP